MGTRGWPISYGKALNVLRASALIFASLLPVQAALAQIIPSDRNFPWNPGMMSKGGIPSRATICATLSPSGSDDSAAIQAKLDSCPSGQVVVLSAGTFIVNNLLLIHTPITLRGAGIGATILKKTNGARARTSQFQPVDPSTYSYDAQPVVIVGPQRWPGFSSSQNLTADGQQGSSSVTIANATGYAAGQFVLLDETSGASWQPVPSGFGCTNSILSSPCPPLVWQGDRVAWNMHYPQQQWQDDNTNSNASGPYDTTPGTPPAAMSWFSRTDRPTSEIKEIASVSGNTITFTSPLSISYRTSHQAQLTQFLGSNAQVVNAGIEDLSVYGGADGGVRFESAAYSWAKNIEVTQWIGEGVAVNRSFRVEVRDSYLHTGSWPEPGGAGYIISFAFSSSEILVENNILFDACKQMVMRSSGAGSVVAYNYADDSWDFDNPNWVEVGLNASHMAGPHHVLFEGNYSQNADSDYTHGNSIYLTFFRNWLSGQRKDFTDSSNPRAVGLAYGSWWDSFVGNVLGRPGQMSGWLYTDPAMSCDASGNNCAGNGSNWTDRVIWKIGYDPERWGMVPDPQTLSTIIRDGNYDFLTNSQRWHNTPGGFTIPNSLYLSSKPAFFGGSGVWPWLNPSNGTINTLPAKARFAGTQTYTITVSASPSAGGSVGGGGVFAAAVPRTVTASANSGYTFTNWTENGSVVSTSASYTFSPNADRNLVANFTVAATNYSISVSASPSAGGTVGGAGTFAAGSSRTVTASTNSGYTFANWTENGTVVSTSANYTFTLNANRVLVANFNPVNYTISLSASPSAGGAVSGAGSFASGSSRTVTATPNAGYTFVNWTESGTAVSTSASYTFTLAANRTLVANFAASQTNYTVAVSAAPVAGGTVGGGGTFVTGTSVTVTATANASYAFVNWTENGTAVSTSASYNFTLTANRNLVANFAPPLVCNVASRLGDFNGDKMSDILWRQTAGALSLWTMNGATIASQLSPGSGTTDWHIAAMADFNGNGKADILWRNDNGALFFWMMNGASILANGSVGSIPTSWHVVATGDFNGDGKSDILWRADSGELFIWLMDGMNVIGSGSLGVVSTDWRVVGTGDFNGDGKYDILFRNISGEVFLWMMSGTSVIGSGSLGTVPTSWHIDALGDFNGDGKTDILLRQDTGAVFLWMMNGTQVIASGSLGTVTTDWNVAAVGDLNGDGRSDIVWRNSTSGAVASWMLNGTAIIGSGNLATSPTLDWSIAGPPGDRLIGETGSRC